jgi:hypothetical protein
MKSLAQKRVHQKENEFYEKIKIAKMYIYQKIILIMLN